MDHLALPEAPRVEEPGLLQEIYQQLGEACKNEALLEHSWVTLGALLLRYRESGQWNKDGFDTFDSFMETLRERFKRGRTQLRSYLGVAEYFLPTISAETLEAIGISNALEMRKQSKLAGKPVPPEIVLEAKDLSGKELRARLAQAFHIQQDPAGVWFDFQGTYFTADQRKEFKDAVRVAMKVLGIKPNVPDHIARGEIMLAFAKEFFGTHAPEVYGQQNPSVYSEAQLKRLGDHADFCEHCALFIEPSPCPVGQTILAGGFVEKIDVGTLVPANENDLVWVLAGDSPSQPVEIFKNYKEALAHDGGAITQMLRAEAVDKIRHAVFARDNYTCTNCGDVSLTWASAHMHEKLHRGQGGNISVSNGTTLCYHCHIETEAGHGKRQPQWSAGSGGS